MLARSTKRPHRHRLTSRARRNNGVCRRRLWTPEGLEAHVLLSGNPTYYTVNLTSDTGASSGTDATTGDPSGDLLWAITQANANTNPAGSVINFDPTVFASPQTITLSSTLELSESAGPEAIDASTVTGPVTISGNDSVGVFLVDSNVTATLSDLTISDGSGYAGGGIDNAGTLTVSDSAIENCSAYLAGGGVYGSGAITVTGSTIANNNASLSSGGGIYSAGGLTVSGSTIEGNSASGDGGGIFAEGATITDSIVENNMSTDGDGGGIRTYDSVTITGTVIQNNSAAGYGGGMRDDDGVATVIGSTIMGNTAADGSGIFNYGTMNITGSTIDSNTAATGGQGTAAGVNNEGTLTITGSTIAGNSSAYSAGGISNGIFVPASAVISDCTITNNTANQAGGIFNGEGTLTVNGSTIAGNSAVGAGGIENDGTATVVDTTIAGNAGDDSGGILNGGTLAAVNDTIAYNSGGGGIDTSGTVTMDNTIVAANTGSQGTSYDIDGVGNSETGQNNLIGIDYTGSFTNGLSGNIVFGPGNPGLGSLAYNNGASTETIALLAGSPAIDAGSADILGVTVPSTDQTGVAWPGGEVSIGACGYPIQPVGTPTVYTVTDTSDNPSDTGSLRCALAQAATDGNPAGNVIQFAIPTTDPNYDPATGSWTITLNPANGPLQLAAGPLQIEGPGAGTLTISGGNQVEVFQEDPGAPVTISGLTIADGSASNAYGGGIIVNYGATLTVTGCIIEDNTAYAGGGAIVNGGNLTVTGATIIEGNSVSATASADGGGVLNYGTLTISGGSSVEDNTATEWGGGVFSEGILTVNDGSTIDNNTAAAGGGIGLLGPNDSYVLYTSATITDAAIEGNSASSTESIYGGGAIWNAHGTLTITDSTIADNSSLYAAGGVQNFFGGNCTITDSTISGNSAVSVAGGLNTDAGGTLTVVGCTIEDNTAAETGGIGCDDTVGEGGTLTVIDSTITGNTATYGNGGGIVAGGSVTVIGSTVGGNSAYGSGGGIANVGTATVMGCTIADNSAEGEIGFGGDGIANYGTLTVSDSTVDFNYGTFGGGLYNYFGVVATLVNTTIANNSGGGIFDAGGTMAAVNVTIAYNSGEGGGVTIGGGEVSLYNSIVALNSPGDINGVPNSVAGEYNLIGSDDTGSLINGSNGNQVGVTNPGLASGLADNGGPTQTIALLAGSPAIGAGMNGAGGFTLFTDQRGYVPPAGVWDIGAYQYNAVPPAAPTATLSAANVTPASYGQTSYTFSVTFASNAAIEESTLAGASVQVVPPSGIGSPIDASVISTVANGPTDPFGNAQSFTVTYSIIPPGGSWSLADDGTYSVTLGGSPVTDIDGTAIASGTIGSFTVQGFATTTALSSNLSTSVYGQLVRFTAKVGASTPGNGTPTGSVVFYDGTTVLGTATLSGGKATLKTRAVFVGSQPITAVYQGDSTFAQSTSPVLTQTVSQDATATKLSSSAATAVYGEPVTFTATVKANSPGSGTPTGSATFYDGTTELGSGTLNSSGVATYTTTPFQLSVGGGQSITAVYSGDPDFTSSTSSAVSQTVNEDATTTSVVSLTGPSVYGQPVTFTATVAASAPGSGTPTGTVTFSRGSTVVGTATLSGGSASFTTTTALAVGSDTIKAAYAGDGVNFKASSGKVTQTVAAASTTTAVVSSTNGQSVYGQSVTFTATVTANAPGSGTPTGSVTFTYGTTSHSVTLSSGTASYTYSSTALATGSDSITVTYNGSTDFAGSSTSITQTVEEDITTTSLTSSVNPSTYGEAVTFTATVAANSPGSGTPTGSIAFYDGSSELGTGTLSGGKATFKTSAFALSAGSNSITAVYSGDQNFTGSASAALTLNVIQDRTTTTLGSSVNPSVVGQSVTFTATISANSPGSGTPTGSVTFEVDSISVGSPVALTNGAASFTTTFTAAGSYTIKAVYSGDSNFLSSKTTLTQTVTSGGSNDAMVMDSIGGAVDQALGTLWADDSSRSPIDDLAVNLAAMRGKKGHGAERV